MVTLNFITVDQVKLTKEITLRETVAALSVGQGYLSCSWKKNVI